MTTVYMQVIYPPPQRTKRSNRHYVAV